METETCLYEGQGEIEGEGIRKWKGWKGWGQIEE